MSVLNYKPQARKPNPKVTAPKKEPQKRQGAFFIDNSNLPTIGFDEVSMSLYSDKEILQEGIEITNSDTNPSNVRGLMSASMGGHSTDITCTTCGLKNTGPSMSCMGHLGYIKLDEYIVKPLFYPILYMVLKSFCRDCAKPVLPPDVLDDLRKRYKGYDLLRNISEESVKYECSKRSDELPEGVNPCRNNPIYSNPKKFPISYKVMFEQYKGEPVQEWAPSGVYNFLDSISDEDAALVGFTGKVKPRDLMSKYLPVIPPCARPTAYAAGMVNDHPLTKSYIAIMSANYELSKVPQGDPRRIELYKNLNMKIEDLISGKGTDTQQKEATSIKDLASRKEGIFRAYITAKRVNSSARTVIGPGTHLKFFQVGIPRRIASRVTRPVRVTNINLDYILKKWHSGEIKKIEYSEPRKKVIDGSEVIENYLKPGVFEVDANNLGVLPKVGDRIHLTMQDGDLVILNRNPSLHRGSMMSLEVVLTDDLTIRFPLSVTAPYNADFDGDEMGLHFVQSNLATSEVEDLMSVRSCLRDDQTSGPRFGMEFDSLTMSQVLTWDEIVVDTKLFNELRNNVSNPDVETIIDRLNEMGNKYNFKYRTEKIEIFDPSDEFIVDLAELGMINALYNVPPSKINKIKKINNNIKMMFSTSRKYWVEVILEHPLDENSREAQEIIVDYIVTNNPKREIADHMTGKSLFSLALPAGFNYMRKGSFFKEYIIDYDEDIIDVFNQNSIPYKIIYRVYGKVDDDKYVVDSVDKSGNYSDINVSAYTTADEDVMRSIKNNIDKVDKEYADLKKELLIFTDSREDETNVIPRVIKEGKYKVNVSITKGMKIENGILYEGNITKADVAGKPNNMLDKIISYHDLVGQPRAVNFLTDLPWITNRWGVNYGFTLGIDDCAIPDTSKAYIQSEIVKTELAAEALGDIPTSEVERQKYERKIAGIAYRLMDIGKRIQADAYKKGNFLRVTTKGDMMNFAMISGVIGAIYYKGQRLGINSDRFIPYFSFSDTSLMAKGYIVNNFMVGLSPREFFMSQYAGREGLIDKAIKTASTGYFNRRVGLALNNLIVMADGSLRDSNANIFQIFAGGNLLAPENMEPSPADFAGGTLRFADVNYVINDMIKT